MTVLSAAARNFIGSRVFSGRDLRPAFWVFCFVALGLSFFLQSSRLQQALVLGLFYAAMSTTYSLVIGHARVLSFAHAAFIGCGAYSYALLSIRWHWPTIGCLLGAAALVSALMAGMGLLTARFEGFQFGIISLSIGAVFTGAVVGYPNIFGGGLGLSGFALIIPANASYRQQLILGIVLWAVCALSVWLVSKSRLGPRVIAVGDDHFLAIASGLNPVRIRVQALAISGALAGLVGAVFASVLVVITPENFGITVVIDLLIIVYVGGERAIVGVLIAAILIKGFPAALGFNSNWLEVAFGVLLAALLIVLPRGLYPSAPSLAADRDWRPRLRRRRPDGIVRGSEPVSIEMQSLSKSFGGVQALTDASLSIFSGEIVGVIGPNGSGKTTLLNCVSGYVTQTSGSILLSRGGLHRTISGVSAYRRVAMGLGRAFQHPRIFNGLTLTQNVAVAQSRNQRAGASRTDVTSVLGSFPLPDVRTPSDRLSHGQRRWLELARLEHMNCDVLLLDEPAAGLTDEEQEVLINHVLRLKADRRAIVLVEHNLHLVARVADRIVVMSQGRILAHGSWTEIAINDDVRQAVGDRLGELGKYRAEFAQDLPSAPTS